MGLRWGVLQSVNNRLAKPYFTIANRRWLVAGIQPVHNTNWIQYEHLVY